jgi:LPXTG-motif cell wall-anchored protein
MNRRLWATMGVAAAFVGLTAGPALAEGDETLGPAETEIASGTGITAGGVGMLYKGAGTIEVEVPGGATVTQVLLYWDGQVSAGNAGDDTAVVEGTTVTGTALATAPQYFFDRSGSQISSAAYRADITSLGLVEAGSNSVEVSGLNFDALGKNLTNGASIVVIYDDGSGASHIELRDGVDNAFLNFPDPRKATVEQTYTFEPSDEDREATFVVVGASAFDETERPNALRVVIDGVETLHENAFSSGDGREHDTIVETVTIPAGATSLTLQALSVDDETDILPASLTWTFGALSVPVPVEEPPTTTTTTTTPETTTTLPPETTTVPEETTSTSTPAETTTTVPETTTTTSGNLPKTGNNTMPLVFAGLGLVLVGGATVLGVRRFRGA